MTYRSRKRRLKPADFHALAARIGRKPVRARKTGLIAARPATPGERVETRWNGVETVNTAEAGDWVVAALDRDGSALRDAEGSANRYIVSGARFETLYAPARGAKARAAAAGDAAAFGEIFRPVAEVEALYLRDGFDIRAPWGERQTASRGYLILSGDEVYGNHADTFNKTYRRLRPAEPEVGDRPGGRAPG